MIDGEHRDNELFSMDERLAEQESRLKYLIVETQKELDRVQYARRVLRESDETDEFLAKSAIGTVVRNPIRSKGLRQNILTLLEEQGYVMTTNVITRMLYDKSVPFDIFKRRVTVTCSHMKKELRLLDTYKESGIPSLWFGLQVWFKDGVPNDEFKPMRTDSHPSMMSVKGTTMILQNIQQAHNSKKRLYQEVISSKLNLSHGLKDPDWITKDSLNKKPPEGGF